MTSAQNHETLPTLDPELVRQNIDFVEQNFHLRLADLGELAKIPGVAWPSFPAEEVQRSAEAVAAKLSALGLFDSVSIERAKYAGSVGYPAVLARRAAKPGFQHVLLYAHHDVQPPGDESEWNSSPFIPELKGDRLYGRGVADDKSGIVTHLSALAALKQLAEDVNLGVTVFIEGEEEAGSRVLTHSLSNTGLHCRRM